MRGRISLLLITIVALLHVSDGEVLGGLFRFFTPDLVAATGTLMPTPYQTVLDTNGNPVSGGCVWTYAAGTTTPATTYTDSALSVANANPIVADGAGRFVAWLSTGTNYKFTYESTPCSSGAHGSVLRTVDNVLAVPGTSNPTTDISTVNARCTLTSGTPVTPSDVTAATSVYIEPYRGNRIALYDGATWNLRTVTATSFAVPATTSTIYDVFVYDASATPTYETLAWTNDTTRATSLTTQDGVLVKSGATTRRYLCSVRTTAVSGQTEDSKTKRYLYNYYNRAERDLLVTDATASWTYTLATWRQANAATANQVDIVQGVAEEAITLSVHASAFNGTSAWANVGIGEDSTSVPTVAGAILMTPSLTLSALVQTSLAKVPAVGRHFYAWLEGSTAAGTTTWYGTNTTVGGNAQTSRLVGRWKS